MSINIPVVNKTIQIKSKSGQVYWLDLVDGILTQGGDLPMTEAAQLFFVELQRIADNLNRSV